jgi:hypothetical protein
MFQHGGKLIQYDDIYKLILFNSSYVRKFQMPAVEPAPVIAHLKESVFLSEKLLGIDEYFVIFLSLSIKIYYRILQK